MGSGHLQNHFNKGLYMVTWRKRIVNTQDSLQQYGIYVTLHFSCWKAHSHLLHLISVIPWVTSPREMDSAANIQPEPKNQQLKASWPAAGRSTLCVYLTPYCFVYFNSFQKDLYLTAFFHGDSLHPATSAVCRCQALNNQE